MADQTFDPRFETLLRQVLTAEAAKVPLVVRPETILERAASRRSARRFGFGTGIQGRPNTALRLSLAIATIVVLAVTAAIGLNYLINRQGLIGPPPSSGVPTPAASPTPEPSVDLGIFEPVAGRIVYSSSGIWGVDPAALADPAARVQLTSEEGIPLGWSRDGTELLIMRPTGTSIGEALLILHADGSETQVTPDRISIRGATISPDGSRVVFAGGTGEFSGEPGSCCSDGFALYAVDAVGGPAEVLWESRKGFVEAPTFAPDGTQIAFVDGAGDNSHSVWVMNADGTDAHQIAFKDCACHVDGLVWSPAGDRIALGILGSNTYTFAPDGSAFNEVITHADRPDGAPLLLQFAYSILWEPGFAKSGPWHPGTLSPSVEPTAAASISVESTLAPVSASNVTELLGGFLEARVAGEGADQYLSDAEVDVPLRYATTSGAPYERGEFEQVRGIEWPYGWTACTRYQRSSSWRRA